MNTQERAGILAGAEEAFFLAMMSGYAGSKNEGSTKTVSNNGCTKSVKFVHGLYLVDDTWHTNPNSDKSAGTTTISHEGIPVWWMCYGGQYTKETVAFLKRALRETYAQKKFVGCRGPLYFRDGIMVYENGFDQSQSFEGFSGDEIVFNDSKGILGTHKYFGMALI